MATRFKGEVASERLVLSTIKEDDQIQTRHEPGTLNDADKGVAKKILQAMPVAVCTSAAATGNKTATLQDSFPDFQLVNGRIVTVYFLNGNNQDTFTLNVAGTGAIPVVYEGLGSQNGLAGICAAGAFLNLKYVDITVSGTRIQRWLACETHNALNGALTNHVSFRKLTLLNDIQGDILEIDNKQLKIVTYIGLIRSQAYLGEAIAVGVKTPVLTYNDDVLVYGYVAGDSNGRVLVRNINNPHIQLDNGECNFVITYSYR